MFIIIIRLIISTYKNITDTDSECFKHLKKVFILKQYKIKHKMVFSHIKYYENAGI